MTLIGNILWLICGGLIGAILFVILGIFYSITIIGLPIGLQCFKMAGLYIAPMGKEVYYSGQSVSTLLNIIWIIFGGIELAMIFALAGALLCLTIVGIPFGRQHFKMAQLALAPFGAEVVSKGGKRMN